MLASTHRCRFKVRALLDCRSKAARRSLTHPRTVPQACERAQEHAAERSQSSRAFSSSQGFTFIASQVHCVNGPQLEQCLCYDGDYNPSRWRDKLGTRYSQLQIVNALRLGERERASKILLNLSDANIPLNAEDFAYILEYCARAPAPAFAMEAWKVMEKKAIHLNKKCSRLIIQAFCKGGYLKEAFNWLTFLAKNDGIRALLPIYNIFLSACGNKQSFIDADHCLELMEHQLTGKSEITYWELLKLAVLQNNLSAVHEIWKDCTTYYNPSILTLRKFIWAFRRLGDLDSAYKTLQDMVSLAAQGSASIRISAVGRYQASRLDIPMPLINSNIDEGFRLRNSELHSLFKGNFVSEHKESLDNAGVNFDLESAKGTPSCGFYAKDVIFSTILGHKILNDEEKGSSSSMTSLPAAVDAQYGNQYLLTKQEMHAIPSMDGIKQHGLVFGALKGSTSLQVVKMLRWSFSDMIHACAQFKNFELAEQLFKEMKGLGLEPSRHTYDGFMKAVIYGKGVAYGMKVIEEMEQRSMKPYNNTLAALSMCLSKNLDLELAEALLERISDSLPKYIHPFNAFLVACDVMDEPERALRILAQMKHINIKRDARTFEILFSLFGNVNIPYERGNMLSHIDVAKRVKAMEMDMMKNGVQHSYLSMKNLIKALGAEGMIQEMFQYLNVAENMLWDTNSYQKTSMYNIVLHSLIKAGESQMAIDVFKNMRICGLPANTATYNIMIECCSILTCFKSAYALVSMMLRGGFCPQLLTYTALIKVFLKNEDFESAMCLWDQSTSEGIQPDIQLFNTILREAYLKGRIDITELIVERIHREKIQPDPSTCWYTFSTYVECSLHSTAMEALQVLSMRMISEEDSILQQNKATFEDLVHNDDADAELQIIEIFKQSQEFLATALLNLRMCAINGSATSWLPNESPWARRLSSCYDARRGVA